MKILYFTLALVLYFSLHSLLASNTFKQFFYTNIISEKYYRIAFNLFAIVTLLPVYYFYAQIVPGYFFENVWVGYLGLSMITIGVILSAISLYHYNLLEFSGIKQLKKDQRKEKLQLKGLNAIVRHPLYFSILLIVWGYFLFQPSDRILALCVILSTYTYVGTKLEEQKLVEEFGKSYETYQKNVSMLIPFFPY